MYIFCGRGLASHRRRPLTSNVRGLQIPPDNPIRYSDIRGTLDAINASISDFAVSFLKRGPQSTGLLAGSGTLVAAGKCHAILTADHVLAGLPDSGDIALILPSRLGPRTTQFILSMNHVHKITLGKASRTPEGPDLGLIALASNDVARLAPTKSFYNLSKRADRMLSSPPQLEPGAWLLCGAPEEWEAMVPASNGQPQSKVFRGTAGAGKVREGVSDAAFDYLEFEARYDDDYEGPQSFEGFSGGGLWQAELTERNGSIEVGELLLSGVAFFQSELANKVRTIYCHGRRSVYKNAAETLAARAP